MQVYRIFNKENGKSYIGITKWTFNTRYNGGKWWKWTHSNHLKKAVKKYGLEAFSYEILNESCKSEDELSVLEKMYIQQYNSYIPNGYNLTIGGGSAKPTHVKEYELVDEFGTIYQVKNLSDFCHKNKLNYGAMLNMVCGINVSSQGFALSSTKIEDIKGINQEFEIEEIKTGKVFVVLKKDIEKFSKKINVEKKHLHSLICKKVYVTHGFKLKETKLNARIREKRVVFDNLKLIDKNGKKITIRNIYKFCKENRYSRSAFYKLLRGKSLEAYGFRLASKNKKQLNEERQLKLGKYFEIKNEQTGEIIKIKNASKFCRDNKLNRNNFQSFIKRRIKKCGGYILPN